MKASVILARVKANMLAGTRTSPFICDHVWYLSADKQIPEKDEERIRNHIRKLLGGRFSIVEWLIDKGHYIGDRCTIDRVKLQATRMAWLDHLIEHYASKGD